MSELLLREFAERVGVPYGTVKRWVHEGMPVVRFGAAVRIVEEAARAWMKTMGRRGRGRRTIIDPAGVVYFAQREDGAIKIGWSGRPRDRVYELRSRYKCVVTLLSFHRALRKLERRVRLHFAAARLDGAWFAATPELLALAASQDSDRWLSAVESLACGTDGCSCARDVSINPGEHRPGIAPTESRVSESATTVPEPKTRAPVRTREEIREVAS